MSMQWLVADLILGDVAEVTFALTDLRYRRAGEELVKEDEMITGDWTTRTHIKISVKTVVSTITKLSDIPQKEKSVPNAEDGIISQACKSVCEIHEYSGGDEYGDTCQSFENVDVDDDVDDHYMVLY